MKPNKTWTVKVIVVVAALAAGSLLAQTGTTQSTKDEIALRAAIEKETVQGDLKGAIELLTKIAQSKDRAIAARALMRLAECHEKLGDQESRKIYERVVRDFADQKDAVAQAQARLGAEKGGHDSGIPFRQVWKLPYDTTVDGPVSPDGRFVAYVDWGKNGNLFLRDLRSGTSRPLTDTATDRLPQPKVEQFAEEHCFSRDGRQLAYSWFREQPNGTSRYELRLIDLTGDGVPPSRLLLDHEDIEWIVPFDWSPDGKAILVNIQRKDKTDHIGWLSIADGSLKVIKSLEWRFWPVFWKSASLSPDGRFVAYSALVNNPKAPPRTLPESTEQHIYVIATDGSSETELVKTAGMNQAPVWTPDGEHLVFTSNLSGKTDLWAIAVRDGKAAGSPSLLKREIGEVRPLGFTRTGSYHYKVDTKTGVEQVSIATLSAAGDERIIQSFVGANPSWSPDGKTVAFKRHSPQSQDTYYAVVRSVDTGQETALSPQGLRADPPRWLHDGSGFLTLMGGPGGDNTQQWWHRVELKTGKFSQTTLQRGTFRSGFAALSPDDKTVYLVTRDPASNSTRLDRIVAVDLATGRENEVFRLPGPPENLPQPAGIGITLSPDGRTLALALTDGKTRETRLALVDVDGGNYRQLSGPYRVNATFDKLVWTKDGRSIVFVTSADRRNWRIMRIATEGGEPEFTGLMVRDLSTFDISPDGRRIAFSTTGAGTRTIELMAIANLPALIKESQ
jgi:Tol biopolymer transport system component